MSGETLMIGMLAVGGSSLDVAFGPGGSARIGLLAEALRAARLPARRRRTTCCDYLEKAFPETEV